MIFFRSDYSSGAHPRIIEALAKTNLEHTDGYSLDPHCENAAALIKKRLGDDSLDIHFTVGGTITNLTAIAAWLRPYQAAVSVASGHIYVHETGAVEATGHKVIAMENSHRMIYLRPLKCTKMSIWCSQSSLIFQILRRQALYIQKQN